MLSLLKKHTPAGIKTVLKQLYFLPFDIFNRFQVSGSMIPPRSINTVWSKNYLQIGKEFKNYFITFCNLKPDSKVLDVGCGAGRMAIPLTSYVSPEGGYWGFDIVRSGITWCQKKVTPKFGNFHFAHCDIYNKYYNATGNGHSIDYHFPYENNFFDLVYLTSVFTHMLPADLEHYLSEIARVLKPGGNCLITFFIINEESKKLIQSNRSSLNFCFTLDGCLTINQEVPEAAIAFRLDFLTALFKKYNLTIKQPIHYGSWCQRETPLSYQDIIVATKAST